MHVGIDVRLDIVNWFSWAFEEPVSPITVLRPEWLFAEGAESHYHFLSSGHDCLVNQFGIDRSYTEPTKGYHTNVVMTFSLELEE